MPEIIHKNITISGKVQGVYFRRHTYEQASQLNVKGFVKNLPNGDVFIEAESDENTMQVFINLCRKGSPQSDVQKVSIEESSSKNFRAFEIILG